MHASVHGPYPTVPDPAMPRHAVPNRTTTHLMWAAVAHYDHGTASDRLHASLHGPYQR